MQEIQTEDDFNLASSRNPPTHVLDSLRVLFSRNSQVESAFVADVVPRGATEPTSLLIAIEVSSDHDQILREAAAIVREHDLQRPTIDLMFIEGNGSDPSSYFFTYASPFYTRAARRN